MWKYLYFMNLQFGTFRTPNEGARCYFPRRGVLNQPPPLSWDVGLNGGNTLHMKVHQSIFLTLKNT